MAEPVEITVRKRPLVNEYEVPGVGYTLATDREDPVRVRLVESLPRSIDTVNVGFDREYGYESWSVRGDRTIVYEDSVRKARPVRTRYVAATTERLVLTKYMREPTIEVCGDDVDDSPGEDWRPVDAVDFRVLEPTVTDCGSGRATVYDRHDETPSAREGAKSNTHGGRAVLTDDR